MISIKNLDLNKFMIYEKSYKNIINYYVAYVTLNSANSFDLIH